MRKSVSYIENLYTTLFEPDNQEIIGTLLILHGMQEHSGRYEEFATYVVGKGFAVLTYDHIGHGRTAKIEEDFGFFSKTKPVEKLIDDAKLVGKYLEEKFPDVPHFVLGHSMGSFITRCLLQEESKRFNGAVLTGTGGRKTGAKIAKAFLAILNAISPKKKHGLINGLFGNMNNSRFKKETELKSTSWLSLSKKNREAFLNDSLNGKPFSNNGFYTLISFIARATDRRWAENISKTFPMLFVSGGDDPIGDFGKGVAQTAEYLKQDGFSDISLKLYPGMRHEILNEDIKEQVYKEIVDLWLCERIK